MNNYVINDFSPVMVKSDNFVCNVTQFNEAEFLEAVAIAEAESLVNDEGIAGLFDLEYTRKYPKFYKGDTVFSIYCTGGKVDKNFEQVKQYTALKYYMIEILED